MIGGSGRPDTTEPVRALVTLAAAPSKTIASASPSAIDDVSHSIGSSPLLIALR